MDFRLPSEALDLAAAVRGFLDDICGPETLRDLDGVGGDAELWDRLTELGLPGLLVPEEHGGMGRKLIDGALIAVECGRAALPGPLVDTALVAVPWLARTGQVGQLEEIAAGKRKIALAHPLNSWVLDGSGPTIRSVDPLRRLSSVEGDPQDDALMADLGALMSAAQLVGLGEAMLDQATAYAQMREQFGQPIGGFQAVKHQLADVAVALEFARPVVWRAAQAMDDGLSSASLHVSHAKYAAGDAAWLASETAIQVHGAMGYTYEVDLHFWMKRSWALVGAWGDRSYHFHRVAAAVRGGKQPLGPRNTFA